QRHPAASSTADAFDRDHIKFLGRKAVQEYDIRVTHTKGRKDELPVRRPRHTTGNECSLLNEVGDLAERAVSRRKRPEVGHAAVGECQGQPPSIRRDHRMNLLPGWDA